MDVTRRRLLRSLSHPGFRTGTALGADLGLSRAAVHKHIRALSRLGVPIDGVPGRGYRLAAGVNLLDPVAIGRQISASVRRLVPEIQVLDEVDSTSAELARRAVQVRHDGRVCLAEKQTAGRGRRGRAWRADPYRDLTMSIGVGYAEWPAGLPALGLVIAATLAGALDTLGVGGLMIKWPNDLVHEGRKLCGVLLDVNGEAHGACRLVVGIGINLSAAGGERAAVDQAWVDAASIVGAPLDRNLVAARCLDALLPVLKSFPSDGFQPYRDAWRRLDVLRGRSVVLRGADRETRVGTAEGVDETGRLRVRDSAGGIRAFSQGDVSVRAR